MSVPKSMLGQSAGLAMKKTIRAFKDEAKELDDDGRQRYNAFKAIIDQLAMTASASVGSKLLIAYVEENLNTPVIQFELDVIGKFLQDTVPIATHSLSGALSQDLKQWTELAEKIMDWFTAKIMSTDSTPVIAQIALEVGAAATAIVKVKDRSETADMIASAIHLLFAINKKSKQVQKKILKEIPLETLGAIFGGSEDPICRYQCLALVTMCLQNIEDSSKNKQEYRKALDAFINQIDPGSGSIDRLRMAIASCKAGEGLQEPRIVEAMNHFDDISGTRVYLANKISFKRKIMLGGAPIAIFIQKDRIYWNGEDLEVCANQEGEETIRTSAKNVWRIPALTVTCAGKSLSIRAAAAQIDTVPPPVTIYLEAADLDCMEERLREGKATIVQATAPVAKQKASKAKDSAKLFGKAPNRGGNDQNGVVDEESRGEPAPILEPDLTPALAFRPEQEVAALADAAENSSEGEDDIESTAPEPQQNPPRPSEPVPSRQSRARKQKQDPPKESLKAASRPGIRPVGQTANGSTRTTRSSAPQEQQADRGSTTETPHQAVEAGDCLARLPQADEDVRLPPGAPQIRLPESGSRSKVPADLQARGNSPDFRSSPLKTVLKTYGKKAQKSPKTLPGSAGVGVKRTPPQVGQTTTVNSSKQKSTPGGAELRKRARQADTTEDVQSTDVEKFQAEACQSSTPKIHVRSVPEAPVGSADTPMDQESSELSSEEGDVGNHDDRQGFDDVFTDHTVNLAVPRVAVEEKSPLRSLLSEAKPIPAPKITHKATSDRAGPPVRPSSQIRKAPIAPVIPAPSQTIHVVDQETPSKKPAAPPKVKSLSRLITNEVTPARSTPRLRPQTTLMAASTEIESDEEEQAIESLNQRSILADIKQRKEQAKRKKESENPLSKSDDFNHPMQEDEAALTEPARKKQKVTEGLIPFLVDENDALGTIRKLMSRINQTVWDDFSAQSAEAPMQAKRCQEDLIADTDEVVRDYANQCLDIYEIWYEGDQQRRSVEHQLVQDINAAHRNANNALKRTRTNIAGLATSKTGLRKALFA